MTWARRYWAWCDRVAQRVVRPLEFWLIRQWMRAEGRRSKG
jgi:hypothetical protein